MQSPHHLRRWFELNVAEDFLDDQETRAEKLSEWIEGDGPPVGFEYSALTIMNPIDVTGTPYQKGYAVRFDIQYQGEIVERLESQVVYNGTRWLWWGDQLWVDLRIHPAAVKQVAVSGMTSFLNGLSVWVTQGVAYDRGVRSVIVTGPGLLPGGQLLEPASFPEPAFAPRGGTVVMLNDSQIASIPDYAEYRVCLYGETPAVVTPSHTPMRCYETVVPRPPLSQSDLMGTVFPVLISPASHSGSTIIVPGQLDVVWQNPSNMQVTYVNFGFRNPLTAETYLISTRVDPGAVQATLNYTTVPAGSRPNYLNLGGSDAYGRTFDFWWLFD
jgi:hypothetical protein